ncbi:MAG TPA: prepilin-type N-terminal cleavage/methylation domain-containing protein [Candidatus Dependentiae bacterium]|nr:prepilin-type N-terminal cleavage/methylation domain-containing protein [Candidatus Dependentiae bacterium]HRQ62919.1 prepilin-type N-terminal cleavage/methylation domain-containing protein [Candidatus Dependentiae bacterium]
MKYCRLRRLSIRWLNKPGISLLELIVVVAIIAVLVTLNTVHSSFLQRILVRAEIEKLYTTCQHARCLAMATNQIQTIYFNTRDNTYSFGDRHEKLTQGIQFGFITGSKGPPAQPQLPLYKPITFQGDKIIFYPDGIVTSGTVYLIDAQGHTMYALSNAVAQVSYLRLYVYRTGWKKI